MKEKELEVTDTTITTELKLILHNDDHNPMEYVIFLLQLRLAVSAQVAEQLTTIAHYKGKAAIKEGGDLEYLMALKSTLQSDGLTVTLE